MKTRSLLIFTALIAMMFFYSHGQANRILTNNSSDISISEKENNDLYTFTCKFSKNHSKEIRAIILGEYPEFDFETNKANNNLDVNLKLKNKKLETEYESRKGSESKNLVKYKRIAEKIRSINS